MVPILVVFITRAFCPKGDYGRITGRFFFRNSPVTDNDAGETNTKFQAPSARETSSSKHQWPVFGASLDVGALWAFNLPPRNSIPRKESVARFRRCARCRRPRA